MTRILVIEDEPGILEALVFLLRKEGFEVATATDGVAGLAEFDRTGGDIVLLDLMLPGLSGSEVCKAIREKSDVPKIGRAHV